MEAFERAVECAGKIRRPNEPRLITYPLFLDSLSSHSHLNKINCMFSILSENFGYCNLDELETLAAGKFVLNGLGRFLNTRWFSSLHLSHIICFFIPFNEISCVDLDKYDGNFFEHSTDEEVLEKEIQDRKDVADILRLQNELRLRMNYLEDANLFADDVHKETERFPEQAW